jgi:lipoprotein NlpD
MTLFRHSAYIIICSFIVACSTNPAPVIDRTPVSKQTSSTIATTSKVSKSAAKTTVNKNGSDWRPDSYIVKKGDTLFSIGLEHGYDYKDIARANNIESPYVIKIGQTLKLDTLKDTNDGKVPAASQTAQPAQTQSDGVITYALDNGNNVQAANSASPSNKPASIINIQEPKATREPFSEEALNKPVVSTKATPATSNKPVIDNAEIKTDAKTVASNTNEDGTISWSWPTKGKVVANFNDAGNKGVDIAGSKGQPINAAAAGKVIYSGSDLRGYGKLVIIKHNNTYLSVYANNSNILVKEGQQVSAGQKIAEMGDTDSNIVKLHFEIRQQGKSVDPSKFLTSN